MGKTVTTAVADSSAPVSGLISASISGGAPLLDIARVMGESDDADAILGDYRSSNNLGNAKSAGLGQLRGITPANSRMRLGGRCSSVMRTPRCDKASSMALVMAGGEPIMPPSPTPR